MIAVTPSFSTSYYGLFKTFFDLLYDGALTGTPVLLGATAGTARHFARTRRTPCREPRRPRWAWYYTVPSRVNTVSPSEL